MKQLGLTVCWTSCVDLLVCPRAVNHNVKLLRSAFNNSKPKLRPHQAKWSLCNTQAITDIFEDWPWRCLPFLPVEPAPLGGSRGINTSFHLILAAGKGQGQMGFELGSPPHVSLLAQACFRHRLSPYTGYCYSLPLWACVPWQILIGVSGDSPLLPFPPYLCNQSHLHFTDKNIHKHREI